MHAHNNIQKFKIGTGQKTRQQICDRIAEIDLILDELYKVALVSVANGDVAEYEIDTGQTKQKVKYTTTSSVRNSIEGDEKIRLMLQNQLAPRKVRLMDSKNFIR